MLNTIHTVGVGEGKHMQCTCENTEMGEKLELEFCLQGAIKHLVEPPLLGASALAPGLSKQFLWVSKVLCIDLLPLLKNRLRVLAVPQLTLQYHF